MLPLLIALLAQQAGGPSAPPATDLRVVVAAPVYHPDGSVTGETVTLPVGSASVMFVFGRRNLCDSATTAAAEPKDAGFGWRVAAHVVSATVSDVVVSVDWRRMWDAGKTLPNGPAGHAQLTLHAGDRIPLDHIPNGTPAEVCRAVGMGLEMRLGRAPVPPGRMTPPLGARDGGTGSLDVDLWLVHTTPAGREQAQHQKVRLNSAGGPFTFAPVKFTTRQGEVGVELNGAFERYTAPGGEYLLVGMSRIITGATAPTGGRGGATSSFVPLPRPDEVLSFEMTSAGAAGGRGGGRARSGGGGGVGGPRGGGGGNATVARGGGGSTAEAARRIEGLASAMQAITLLDGHQFSLRVRVTPVSGS